MAELAGVESAARAPLRIRWPEGRPAPRTMWRWLSPLLLLPFGMLAYVITEQGSLLLLGYLAIAAVSVAILLQPFVGLAALTGIFAAEYVIPIEGAMSVTKAIGWVTLFSVICRLGLERRIRVTSRPMLVYMVILLGIMGLSVFAARDEVSALVVFLTYVQLVVFVFVTMHLVTSERRMLALVWTLLAVVGVSAVVGVIQFTRGGMTRAVGLVADPNMFSLVIGVALPFVMAMIRRHSIPLARVGLSLVLALLVVAVGVSLSRGGYIAFAVGLLLGIIRFVRPLQTLSGTLAFIVLVVVMGHLPSAVWRRAESIGPAILRGRDTMGVRYDLWRTGCAMIRERPWLGVGLHNTIVTAPEYRPPDADTRRRMLHNAYLDIGAEAGIPALVVFLLLLVSAWRESRRAARIFARHPRSQNLRYIAQCVEIGLIIWMIQAMSLSIGTHKMLWLMLAWCAALARLAAVDAQHAPSGNARRGA
ncbi:hypothetical protein AMK68_05120 [candidate division KD3-62 bacterium DG_56]|uniref:O-antigen ligase-related domain-containing protein n=1 Tax=candidate division KD3-62 bacterium DG_56 TaxID=1704032 RepID=A0A0S7XK94_9BACT|nr:MAG: hypothetical protein AMK68_05120 [candidate division KD3-62 bacterium DG_56]